MNFAFLAVASEAEATSSRDCKKAKHENKGTALHMFEMSSSTASIYWSSAWIIWHVFLAQLLLTSCDLGPLHVLVESICLSTLATATLPGSILSGASI